MLVLLVATTIIIKAGFFNGILPDSNSNPPSISTPEVDDKDDDNPPQQKDPDQTDAPQVPTPPPDKTDNDEHYDDDVDLNMPSTKFPTKLINYCLSKLANATGYQSSVYFTTKLSASALGQTLSTMQYVEGTVIKSQDKRFENMKFVAEGIAQQFTILHNLQVCYNDGKDNYRWKTDKGVFDIEKAHFTKNARDFKFYYDFLYPEFEFNQNGHQISIAIEENEDGKSEYKVKVKLIDLNYCPENFLRSYNSFSSVVKIKSIVQNATFTIDTTSGWIKSLVKNDTFIGEYAQYAGIDVKMELSFTQRFSKHNQIIDIVTPNFPNT